MKRTSQDNPLGLPDTASSTQSFRRIVRKVIAAKKATYIIQNGDYILYLPNGRTWRVHLHGDSIRTFDETPVI